jgi:hypothetical protein
VTFSPVLALRKNPRLFKAAGKASKMRTEEEITEKRKDCFFISRDMQDI